LPNDCGSILCLYFIGATAWLAAPHSRIRRERACGTGDYWHCYCHFWCSFGDDNESMGRGADGLGFGVVPLCRCRFQHFRNDESAWIGTYTGLLALMYLAGVRWFKNASTGWRLCKFLRPQA